MKYFLKCVNQFADFNGRARRTEYWMFALFNIIFGIAAATLDVLLETDFIVYGLYVLALFLPGLAVLVRRLHDVGKSGWMIFISLIPLIGGIWLFVLLVTDSDPGDNAYGPNPKNVGGSSYSESTVLDSNY
jgi:uncharacterized membrane protein YhaH (DUF805 family)